MFSRTHSLYTRLSFLLVGLFTVLPARVFGAEDCEDLDIDLEIAIGSTTEVEGLTSYVTLVYQFVVSGVTILAAVAIMYWGFRWVTAAGNQNIIGSAKEGITSALIGLVIGLTSYTILFTINASFVTFPKICATGLDFQSYGGGWESCLERASNNSRECATHDYCDSARGCYCGPLRGSQAFYCLPLAQDELSNGLRCSVDDNCKDPLKCVGGGGAEAGYCAQLNYEAPCEVDGDCMQPLNCLETRINGKQCLTTSGRSEGHFCDDDDQCRSGVCSDQRDECLRGEEGDPCLSQDECQWGYTCESGGCQAKAVNDDCDSDNGCPGTMHCVDTIGPGGTCQTGEEGASCDYDAHCNNGGYCLDTRKTPTYTNTCLDGSDGDPCDADEDCQNRSCWKGFFSLPSCIAPTEEYAYCEQDSDCPTAYPFCALNKCFDGRSTDWCEDSSDCAEGCYCGGQGCVC
jgi:hypothetical protein